MEVIKETIDIKNNENKIQEEKKENLKEKSNPINKTKINNKEEAKIEGTYLITKEKVNSITFLRKVKYYKGIISEKYVYDSFLNGQLLDLNDKSIFEKYQLK